MTTFKVYFEDGNSLVTGFNGSLKDAQSYFVGQVFNFGDTEEHPKDLMVKAVKVEELI